MTDPQFNAQPTDLLTIREASRRTAVGLATLRSWIYHDKVVNTYRIPGKPHRVLVSERQVRGVSERWRGRRDARRGTGRTTLTLYEHQAADARQLAAMLTERLGCRVSIRDAVTLAIDRMLDHEKQHIAPGATAGDDRLDGNLPSTEPGAFHSTTEEA